MRVMVTATHAAFEEDSNGPGVGIVEGFLQALRSHSLEVDYMTLPVAHGGVTTALDLLRAIDLDRCPLGYRIDALVSLDWMSAFLRHERNVTWLLRETVLPCDRACRLLAAGVVPNSVFAATEALAEQARDLGFSVAGIVKPEAGAHHTEEFRRGWDQVIADLGLLAGPVA